MTREEAIHEIKQWDFINNDEMEALRTLIPELRESEPEDERIRKWIIEELEITRDAMSGKNDYSDDPDIIARLKRLDEALSWLEKQKEEKHATIEQVYEKFLSSDTLKSAKENKYIRAQLLWELMHNGIITEADYQYLTYDKRKPWTAEEYRIAY